MIVALTASAAAWGYDKHACVASSEDGQRLRAAGKLVEARLAFRMCADATCPDVVKNACAAWSDEVDRAIPTIVLGAKDEHGDAVDVHVDIDGTASADALDGRPVAVDPGPHTIKLTRRNDTRTLTIVAREGDKDRPVVVSFEAPHVAEPRIVVSHPARTAGFITAAGGVATAIGFGVLAIKSHVEYENLVGSCAALGCTPAQVDPVHAEQIAADVLLGVTAGLAVLATVLVLLPPTETRVSVGLGAVRLRF